MTFELTHFDWTRFCLSFAGRSYFFSFATIICTEIDCFAYQDPFSDMIVGNFFMWRSLIDKHLKSWQFAFLPSTGHPQTWLFLNLYFPTGFCENSCGIWLRNILGLDSLNSIPVVLHKHDGLIVDQYLFSDCILAKMIWNLIRENFKVWQFALLTSRPSHAWTICLSIVAKLVWKLI